MVIRRRKVAKHGTQVAIAYLRCSKATQELSPHAQTEAIQRFARAQGIELVATFLDFDVSSVTEVADRPSLPAALAYLAEHKGTILLVAKRDRLARDPWITGTIEREARKAGGRVMSTEGANEDGDAMRRGLDDLMSAEELRRIRSRTRAALAVKKARNEVTGSAPYGYQVGADGVHLEPNAGEQRVIARALALHNEGSSIRKLTAALTAEGYVNRQGTALSFHGVYGWLRPMIGE